MFQLGRGTTPALTSYHVSMPYPKTGLCSFFGGSAECWNEQINFRKVVICRLLDKSINYECIQRAYDSLKSRLLKLKENASQLLQEDELNICDKLRTLKQTLGRTYRQWCNQTDRTHTSHTSDHHAHDMRPQDSASNVGSRGSQASLTPSELARKQIDIDLERPKLQTEFESQQSELTLKLRLAELQAKEKRLALSNPGSMISGHSRLTQRTAYISLVYRPAVNTWKHHLQLL